MLPRPLVSPLARMLGTASLAIVMLVPAPAAPAVERVVAADVSPQTASAGPASFVPVFPQDVGVTWFEPTFGFRRPGGRVHHGIDLMAPKMTPVYAVADGIVTAKGEGATAGYHIALEHGGWASRYMHLNDDTPGTDDGQAHVSRVFAPGTEIGDFVYAGQTIGYVGDSGNAEGTMPHTHFELYRDGELVDPYPFLVEGMERALAALSAERRAALLPRVDVQLRLAASSSSATLAAMAASPWDGSTTADSSVAVGGGLPSITHIDR